jgi:hypothetical protein
MDTSDRAKLPVLLIVMLLTLIADPDPATEEELLPPLLPLLPLLLLLLNSEIDIEAPGGDKLETESWRHTLIVPSTEPIRVQ